jgi:hypothetical protein
LIKEAKRIKDNEEYGDPGSEHEWASDVDSQGKQIWGVEGEDYEWHHKEDKEAYEKGLSTVPEPMNLQ